MLILFSMVDLSLSESAALLLLDTWGILKLVNVDPSSQCSEWVDWYNHVELLNSLEYVTSFVF